MRSTFPCGVSTPSYATEPTTTRDIATIVAGDCDNSPFPNANSHRVHALADAQLRREELCLLLDPKFAASGRRGHHLPVSLRASGRAESRDLGHGLLAKPGAPWIRGRFQLLARSP